MAKAVKQKQTKLCARCGRVFANRKKWQSRGVWQDVLYCSKACRSSKSVG